MPELKIESFDHFKSKHKNVTEDQVQNMYALKEHINDYEDIAILKYKHNEKTRWRKFKLIYEHIEENGLHGILACNCDTPRNNRSRLQPFYMRKSVGNPKQTKPVESFDMQNLGDDLAKKQGSALFLTEPPENKPVSKKLASFQLHSSQQK